MQQEVPVAAVALLFDYAESIEGGHQLLRAVVEDVGSEKCTEALDYSFLQRRSSALTLQRLFPEDSNDAPSLKLLRHAIAVLTKLHDNLQIDYTSHELSVECSELLQQLAMIGMFTAISQEMPLEHALNSFFASTDKDSAVVMTLRNISSLSARAKRVQLQNLKKDSSYPSFLKKLHQFLRRLLSSRSFLERISDKVSASESEKMEIDHPIVLGSVDGNLSDDTFQHAESIHLDDEEELSSDIPEENPPQVLRVCSSINWLQAAGGWSDEEMYQIWRCTSAPVLNFLYNKRQANIRK